MIEVMGSEVCAIHCHLARIRFQQYGYSPNTFYQTVIDLMLAGF